MTEEFPPTAPGPGAPGQELDCDEVVELVTEYLDGALDPVTERRFVQHVEQDCPGCRRYFGQIQQTIGTLGELPPASDTLPADARESLLTAFRTWHR